MASIAIIGGKDGYGVSALCAAIAIAQTHTHKVTLLQADSTTSTNSLSDKTLHITPNASRVLKALGCDLTEHSLTPEQLQIRSASNGFTMAQQALGDLASARWNAPYLLVNESVVQEQLQQMARSLDIGTTSSPPSSDAVFRAEPLRRPEASDRASLPSSLPSSLSKMASYSGTVPHAQLPSEFSALNDKLVIGQWLAPHQFVQHSPRPSGGMDLQLIVPAKLPTEFAGTASLTALLHQVAWQRDDFAEDAEAHETSAQTQPPMDDVINIGHAGTDPLPLLYQRTPLAIEDAWVLSRLLEQQEDDIDQGIVEYQQFRDRRRQRVCREIAAMAARYTNPSTMVRWQQNLSLALGSRFLPELALAKLDWLYGYDCVRGFH